VKFHPRGPDLAGTAIASRICNDETRFHLNGVFFESGGSKCRMVLTDGHRLSKVERTFLSGPKLSAGVIIVLLRSAIPCARRSGKITCRIVAAMKWCGTWRQRTLVVKPRGEQGALPMPGPPVSATQRSARRNGQHDATVSTTQRSARRSGQHDAAVSTTQRSARPSTRT
jgi:hypothetical protein